MRSLEPAARARALSKGSAGVVLEKCDGAAIVDDIVHLFDRNGNPYSREHLIWYLSDNGYGKPLTWVLRARDDHQVVGFSCVMPRQFRCGPTHLTLGIVGNLLVDSEKRRSLGAVDLIRAAQSLVTRKEVDLLVGVTDTYGRQLSSRLGYKVLGRIEPQEVIQRSSALLRARLGWVGIPVSIAIDLLAASHRFVAARAVRSFQVVELNWDVTPHIVKWASLDDHFAQQPSGSFLQHFRDAPSTRYRVLGLVDPSSKDLCGCVVVKEGAGRVHICDCYTDARRLGEAEAILNVCRNWGGGGGVFSVMTLAGSYLDRELGKFGFLRLPALIQRHDRWLVGFWRPDHPLAQEFSKPDRWNVFLESSYV